jgi:ribosome recycling factor
MDALFEKTKQRMEKCLDSIERDYKAVRAGRANPGILDRITVDYYGVPTPLNQMAAISVPEPRMLMIQPWDASTIREIEKAINTSDIGINPSNDGKVSAFHSRRLPRSAVRNWLRISPRERKRQRLP